MENNNSEPNVIIKYSSYTPAQKRATQKYRQNNKEKVNEQRKKYYEQRKQNDPSFLEYKRTKAKEYYQRNKAKKQIEELYVEQENTEESNTEALECKPDIVVDIIENVLADITIDEQPQPQRPTRKFKKKARIEDELQLPVPEKIPAKFLRKTYNPAKFIRKIG